MKIDTNDLNKLVSDYIRFVAGHLSCDSEPSVDVVRQLRALQSLEPWDWDEFIPHPTADILDRHRVSALSIANTRLAHGYRVKRHRISNGIYVNVGRCHMQVEEFSKAFPIFCVIEESYDDWSMYKDNKPPFTFI